MALPDRWRPVRWVLCALIAAAVAAPAWACDRPVGVCTHDSAGAFALVADGVPAPIVVDGTDDPAVRSAADGFAGDVAKVAGAGAGHAVTALPASGQVVLIGQLGHSRLIDRLVADGRVSAAGIAGKWEAYRQIVVDRPFPGIDRALVIVGADRRGAVYGAYDLSEKIGVSPWTWWADVPVRRQRTLFITAGARSDMPKVKYRGIFINDEDPGFGTWARKRFGGVNAKLYGHVFDLVLRLKGNYLWPAMWGKAIGADDPAAMPLADAKGVVLGTSHHEPMTRAQAEWHRALQSGAASGPWDYTSNAATLRAFWRGGIERMVHGGSRGRPMEQLVTIGMRGDGDEPMGKGTAISLLERIVHDQRAIIADVTGRPAAETPQLWALYKEVQDYYDQGMKVPDDVTLLFADDNWGQIRRLPTRDLDRPGGYGVYYHFDYVGGPRSYTWLNTNQIAKTWQQMDLAYRSGVRTIWIVNVGDVKPMEYPISFFLKMAWDPEAMSAEAMAAFPTQWASETFGSGVGAQIGEILEDYSRLASLRKPELIDATSFPLGGHSAAALDGGEFGRLVGQWDALSQRVAAVRSRLAPDQRDAFFQLVDFPVAAMANLYRLYYAVAWNRALAAERDPRANVFAERAEAAFRRDQDLTAAYHALNHGKWDGMMLQPHIGYTSWRAPEHNIMPAVQRVGAGGEPAPKITFAAAGAREGNYAVAEADAVTRSVGAKGLAWRIVPHLGRTGAAIGTFPQARGATDAADGVRADYVMTLPQGGDATLRLDLAPSLNTTGDGGLGIGVSVDGGPVRTLTMRLDVDGPAWSDAVRNNAVPLEAHLGRLDAGRHTVSLWRIDGNVLVERLVLYTGPLPPNDVDPPPRRS